MQAADARGAGGCFDYRKSASFKFNVEGLGRRINHECKYEEPGHQGAYCKEALLIDGYKAEVMCELAWEDVSFAPAGAVHHYYFTPGGTKSIETALHGAPS